MIGAKCLALEGCPNFRDLGGYSCGDGRVTAQNRFYRADCLSKLSAVDIELLREKGVKHVVDLRHDIEIANAANRLDGCEGFTYRNISLADGIQSSGLKGLMPESLGKMYVALVDEAGGTIADVLRELAAHSEDGAVVFNCTAGKDRTGVIAALLLLLAGVDEELIISDYAASYELMKPIFDEQIAGAKLAGIDIPLHLMMSEPENMKALLSHISGSYGDIVSYLLSAGMTEAEISRLKAALTEDVK